MKRLLHVDSKSKEIENILHHEKRTLIRGANIKKYPYRMINKGDTLFLVNTIGDGIVRVSCKVKATTFPDAMKESEVVKLLEELKDDIKMSDQKLEYIKKRKYISIIEIEDVEERYATYDSSLYGKKEDFLIIKDIKKELK